MYGGSNGIYGLHVIHNGLFAECETLRIFEDFVFQGQGLEVRGQGQKLNVNSKLVLEDPRGHGL